jgi:co-chaperonin GroES (HSP10)
MLSPLNDWVLVKLDPIEKKVANLFLVHGRRVRTATVISVGKGRVDEKKILQPVDLKPGERVAFFREHLEHKQGKLLIENLEDFGEDLGLLRAMDVLFAFEGEIDVDG